MTVRSTAFAIAAVASSVYGYGVTLDKGLIPNFHADLPVYKLGAPVSLPQTFLSSTLKSVAPNAQMVSNNGVIASDGGAAVAFVHPATGAATFFPQVASLSPSASIDTKGHAEVFADAAIFPKDDTTVQAQPGPKLMTQFHFNEGLSPNSSDPQPLLEHVIAQRTVAIDGKSTLPVRGVGSKAVLGYGAGGALNSFNYHWHPAKSSGKVTPATVQEVHDAIVAQLQPASKNAPYTVTNVEAWYYDSGATYLQPVFYFTAERDANKTLPKGSVDAPVKLAGYVPAGKAALEPLPDLTKPGDTKAPAAPPADGKKPSKAREEGQGFVARALGLGSKRNVLPQVTVGRYVVRNDDAGWVASANNFWNNLSAQSGKYANFINSQYYWAYVYEFISSKDYYVNSVNLALTEVHGNWDLFTTYQNWGEVVYLNQIPSTGYGGLNRLAYWVIHSCEVIPSVVDYPSAPMTSYSVWWNVFNGLHAVLGYRTEMYINDGVTSNFGSWIGQNVPVVSAWLSAVHNDWYWYGSNPLYYDYNRGINEPFGRASTVYVCGHAGDVVGNTANLGKANCLQETYYAN